jgi:formamidopyrimidine-DNA glycosylase
MPELPEVETIKQGLLEKIKGKKIKDVEVKTPKLVNFLVKEFKKGTIGAKINNIRRRAKLLILNLSNKNSVIIHLKLTGQLIFEGEIDKSTRAIFYFTDGAHLIFNDWRKFGYFKLMPTGKLERFFKDQKFGPEPLEKDFTLDKFKGILSKKPRSKIKPFLMNQGNVAGIGNVYSDESLFDAKILPIRLVKGLKPVEIKNLYQSIRKVLVWALKYKGVSTDTYVDIFGKKGELVPLLKVYHRQGQKCLRCRGTIEKIKLGGRSAHFCPKCQK